MGQLEDMAMFVRVVEAGSITKAAEQLNIAKSAVSRRLKDLENRLGNQLISRTTRQSNLTEAGEHYYRQANNILSEVDALNEQTSGTPTRIEGTLKMTAPLSFGLMHLNDVIDEYANQHPHQQPTDQIHGKRTKGIVRAEQRQHRAASQIARAGSDRTTDHDIEKGKHSRALA